MDSGNRKVDIPVEEQSNVIDSTNSGPSLKTPPEKNRRRKMTRRKRKLKSHRLGRGQGPDQVPDRGLDQENGQNPGEGQDQDHENVARGQGLEKDPDLGLGGGLGQNQGSDRDLGGAQDLE